MSKTKSRTYVRARPTTRRDTLKIGGKVPFNFSIEIRRAYDSDLMAGAVEYFTEIFLDEAMCDYRKYRSLIGKTGERQS